MSSSRVSAMIMTLNDVLVTPAGNVAKYGPFLKSTLLPVILVYEFIVHININVSVLTICSDIFSFNLYSNIS